MFEKNLQDLVKGIRSAKGDVTVYISQALQEIKVELRSTDPFIKAQAVRKLTYLHMLGYDMCWAAFHVVEVMSYERFAHKRIGYNAACKSFPQSTDVVLLCTNLLKKEFGSTSEYEVGLAINVLANIVTTDLARDLLGDVLAMMGSPKPYVRKKSTLVLYKMFLRYPQGLRLSFDRLKERMEEPDVTVVSCAVNVICELANKKPKNYLGLAPQFFRLLTTSSNNWMLIKVVKLLASLVPEEPRLARKLLDPLATVIQNTPAKSLLYECISTVTTALLYTKKSDGSQPRNVAPVVRLCNDHLRRYIEDPDQNLRYLGLVGLGNLMKSHPYVVTEHQELIVECLAVDDITIRMRALELLSGMVNPDNAAPIIRELMRQTLSADGAYRHELITHILHVCSVNKYANIHDFDWYIHVLVQLARVPGNTAATVGASLSSLAPSSGSMLGSSSSSSKMKVADDEPAKRSHGVEVARQLVDIAVRVKSVRSVMVDNMIELLMEKEALSGPGAGTLQEVYYAAAWITGEYVMEFLDDVDDEEEDESEEEERETEEEKLQRLEDLADEMLQPRTTTLPGHVQTVFIQALLKILTAMAERADDATVERIATVIMERLPAFVQSEYIEVQERAVCLQQLLLALGMGLGALTAHERTERAFDGSASLDPAKRLDVLNSYFAERLAPVGVKAQRKVPLPGDLDLDEPLSNSEAKFLESGGDVSAFSSEDDLEVSFVSQGHAGIGGGYSGIGDGSPERKAGHKHRRHDHSSSESESEAESENSADEKERKEREYAREQERLRKDPFYLSGGSQASAGAGANAGFGNMIGALGSNGKKKKASKKSKSRDILEDELMPEGARSSDEDRRRARKKRGSVGEDETDLAAVDLSIPLGENEKVPTDQWFHRQTPAKPAEDDKKSKKKSSTHKKSSRGDDDSKKKKKKDASSKSSKSKKSSRKQDLLIGGFSEEEEDKKKRKDKSSRRPEAPPAEPLLLF
ncbi:AP-3 complex subunit delta, putative [Phytophthora infestans T30-4]|uniref:AP-3 complex subunit delta n=1 Tax=Phytophthora infestans (strain T30-4) TaxID=403677 RepID=D0NQK5_PHYIT|nr:AP-3 complex subunit delta, putative [Phytophthora infestans T30-4]EEY62953.1 AP-3 complex subunit delta, putative [Phytophthora infestans T30-4]|eukprot:XP_002898476.1 AP-3 complex subunit delta, putative [Phytophthora infestans T30-4]